MPITKSAKKALHSSARKRVFNLQRRGAMKQAIQTLTKAQAGDTKPKDLAILLNSAYQAIDKAAKRGVIKPNTAARKKSQMAKLVAVTKKK